MIVPFFSQRRLSSQYGKMRILLLFLIFSWDWMQSFVLPTYISWFDESFANVSTKIVISLLTISWNQLLVVQSSTKYSWFHGSFANNLLEKILKNLISKVKINLKYFSSCVSCKNNPEIFFYLVLLVSRYISWFLAKVYVIGKYFVKSIYKLQYYVIT